MNTKGMKFLAVLAVLAMAFAAFAVVAPAETDDATAADGAAYSDQEVKIVVTGGTKAGSYGYTTVGEAVAAEASTYSDATSFVITVMKATTESGAITINDKTTLYTGNPDSAEAATWTLGANVTVAGKIVVVDFTKITFSNYTISLNAGAEVSGAYDAGNKYTVYPVLTKANSTFQNGKVTIEGDATFFNQAVATLVLETVTFNENVTLKAGLPTVVKSGGLLTIASGKTFTTESGAGFAVMDKSDGVLGTNGIARSGTIVLSAGSLTFFGVNSSGNMLNQANVKIYGGAAVWGGTAAKNALVVPANYGAPTYDPDDINSVIKMEAASTNYLEMKPILNNESPVGTAYTINGNATYYHSSDVFTKTTDTIAIAGGAVLTVPANKAFTNNNVISGNGTIKVYGTLTAPASTTSAQIEVYDGGVWTEYIGTGSGTALKYTATAGSTEKVLSSKTTKDSQDKMTSEFTIYKDMELVAVGWMDNDSVEKVTLNSAKLTIGSAATVGANDVLTLDSGSSIVDANVAGITNKGTINFASLDQVGSITNSGDAAKIYVAGEELETVTGSAEAINTATESGDNVIATISTNQTAEIKLADSEAVLTFTNNDQTALNITMSDAGELRMATTGNVKISGTVKIGTQNPITFTDVKGDFTITKGSIVISGDDVKAGTITVPADETAIIDGLTLASGDNLTITLNDGSKVVFRNNVTIAANSVIIGIAANASAKVVVEDGASITGNGDFVIGAAGDDVKTTIEGTVEMKAGETLTIYGTVNLSSEITGAVVNNGTINLYTGADISDATITGDGEMKDKTSETEMEDLIFTGESAQGLITYTANQNVIVNGTWTLVKGAFITIKGSLNVPEGCKLVIEPGATLTIDNKTAVANIDGTIVIEEADSGKDNAAVFTVTTGAVYISGTATVNGIMDVPGLAVNQPASVVVLAGGALNLAKTGVLTVGDNGSITVLTASSFTVLGSLNATNIYNYGTVTINTSVPASGSSTIYMAANAAVVDIVKFTLDQNNRTLTISDYGLLYYTDKSGAAPVSYSVGKAGIAQFKTYVNEVVIGGNITGVTSPDYYAIVTGIKVVEKVTSKDAEYKNTTHGYVAPIEKAYTNNMLVDGQINVSMSYVGTGTAESAAKATAKVTTNGLETIEIAADTTVYVGFGVTLENAVNATLKVSGTLDADDIISSVDDRTPVFENKGTMTLAGKGIATRAAIAIGGTINGAHIEVGILPIHTYVTVDKVLEMAAADPTIDDITLLGKNTMSKSATLPEDVVMTLSGATLNIGSTAGADVTFTIAADATLKGNGRITVNGTMYAYDQTDVKGNEIVSDVKKVETNAAGKVVKNGWALWTNIVTAINTAQAGDVITIAKTEEQGYVTITSSTEIKDGVTVIVPEDAAPIYLKNGVTLTVSGVLSTEQDIYAEKLFDKTAYNTKDAQASAIVVNGLLLLPDAAKFKDTYKLGTAATAEGPAKLSAGAPISGAYFKTDDNNAIASITVATENVDLIIGKIVLNGTVSASAVTFTATNDCSVMEIGKKISAAYPTEVSITTLTLDGTTFQNNSDGTFTGTIASESGSVNVAGMTDAFMIKDKDDKLTLGGTVDTSASGATISVASGKVFTANGLVVKARASSPMSISAGAQLIVSGASASVDYLTVSGTLAIENECSLTVGKNLTVSGTVTVSPATASKGAGTLSITELMFVGMKSSDLTESAAYIPTQNVAAAAALLGAFAPADAAIVYIAAGSTVNDDAQETLDAMKYHVTIEVEGAEWFTAYTNDANAIVEVYTVPVDNAQFVTLYDGTTAMDTDVKNSKKYVPVDIESKNGKTLKAKVEYNIYSVTIYTDAGVKSVAIDGIELEVSNNANKFTTVTNLKAGTHKVSYTLMEGYTGTPTLYTLDHTVLKDLSFTVSSAAGLAYEFQLSGTEKYVPEPVTPEEQSEWTITTILLVILVILIAIMAVIVAIRLNRS